MTIAAHVLRKTTAASAVTAAAPAEAATADVLHAQSYVGLVTRTLAFAVDAAIIDAVALITAAVAALALSIVNVPEELRAFAIAASGVVFLLWTVAYFTVFWSTTGQTPGSRLMRIRVRAAAGERLKPRRALLRFAGLTLAAIPFFAGFALILVDDRRRGLHDRIARTVVVEAEDR